MHSVLARNSPLSFPVVRHAFMWEGSIEVGVIPQSQQIASSFLGYTFWIKIRQPRMPIGGWDETFKDDFARRYGADAVVHECLRRRRSKEPTRVLNRRCLYEGWRPVGQLPRGV